MAVHVQHFTSLTKVSYNHDQTHWLLTTEICLDRTLKFGGYLEPRPSTLAASLSAKSGALVLHI